MSKNTGRYYSVVALIVLLFIFSLIGIWYVFQGLLITMDGGLALLLTIMIYVLVNLVSYNFSYLKDDNEQLYQILNVMRILLAVIASVLYAWAGSIGVSSYMHLGIGIGSFPLVLSVVFLLSTIACSILAFTTWL